MARGDQFRGIETTSADYHGQETTYRHRDAGGEGPTLLCVHGSDGAYGVWCGRFRLASDYPVATLDLSDHSDSDNVDVDAGYGTLSAYVDGVIAVAEKTDANILVGNSLGGAAILTLALEHDLDLDVFVLVGTGAKLAVLSDLLDRLENDFNRAISFLHGEGKLPHTDDERLAKGSKGAVYDAGQTIILRDFLSCHTFDMRNEMSEISMPTLALIGEYDRLVPPPYHEYLAEMMSDDELGTAEDATHLVMLEQPAAFNEAMKSFLDRRVA